MHKKMYKKERLSTVAGHSGLIAKQNEQVVKFLKKTVDVRKA